MDKSATENEKTTGTETIEMEIEIQELEARVAPGMYRNHNETLVED